MKERTSPRLAGLALACLAISGCSMGLHGSFSPHSWASPAQRASSNFVGDVEGRSCQTRALYALGMGEPATTDEAIKDAKSQYPDTVFIADISIDDEVSWYFPYSVQCIVVRARAYR
ncbi:MAG: hypothetical protein P8080_04500 [Gammaproteobacteria bacterium]